MTTATETITVPEAAKRIAAEIREHGHYQSGIINTLVGSTKRCMVLNETFPCLSVSVRLGLYAEIIDRVKHTSSFDGISTHIPERSKIVLWNDRTPTPQVLEVLDSIAASDGA